MRGESTLNIEYSPDGKKKKKKNKSGKREHLDASITPMGYCPRFV
jgi:hypothetical protein